MKNRPNILLLMTDQQRFDSLGCYGVPFARTPNLDRLASGGVVFEHCYANNPICTPVRASMMTGKHLPDHGVYRLYDNLPADEVLFTHRLREVGYRTALFGKLHVSAIDTEANERHPHDGFDVYEPCIEGCARMEAPYQAYVRWLKDKDAAFYNRLLREGRGLRHVPREYHMSHWAAERSVAFIEHADRSQPFFCMMSIFEPHNPYEHYPRDMADAMDANAVVPALDQVANDEPADIGRERRESYLGDYEALTPEDVRKIRHGYHASVAYADEEFGRVLDALDRQGLADSTLVIFVSDHGDMLGDHRLLVKGAFFYDPCTRVPLIMRWPRRFAGGRRVNGLVQSHDIAATVLSAAGVESVELATCMPEAIDLTPLAAGECKQGHETAVCCYRNSGINTQNAYWDPPIHATMIRDEQFKLTCYLSSDGSVCAGELFDMDGDPHELNNLWNDHGYRDVREELTVHALKLENRFAEVTPSRGGSTLPVVRMQNRMMP